MHFFHLLLLFFFFIHVATTRHSIIDRSRLIFTRKNKTMKHYGEAPVKRRIAQISWISFFHCVILKVMLLRVLSTSHTYMSLFIFLLLNGNIMLTRNDVIVLVTRQQHNQEIKNAPCTLITARERKRETYNSIVPGITASSHSLRKLLCVFDGYSVESLYRFLLLEINDDKYFLLSSRESQVYVFSSILGLLVINFISLYVI